MTIQESIAPELFGEPAFERSHQSCPGCEQLAFGPRNKFCTGFGLTTTGHLLCSQWHSMVSRDAGLSFYTIWRKKEKRAVVVKSPRPGSWEWKWQLDRMRAAGIAEWRIKACEQNARTP